MNCLLPIRRKFINALIFLSPFFIALQSLAASGSGDMEDHPRFAHAMAVETRKIDGFPVVFQYGQVRPDFSSSAPSSQRARIALTNAWKFRFDPEDLGTAEEWFAQTAAASGWSDVRIPHCWDMMPGGRFHDWTDNTPTNPPHYNGAAWYRLEFDHRPAPRRHHRIEFLCVQQRARIYINGQEVAATNAIPSGQT